MAYFINYWKFNEIRRCNHEHSNVSQHLFRKIVGIEDSALRAAIKKPDARSLGSSVTEITVRCGKLALYPVDLTKK